MLSNDIKIKLIWEAAYTHTYMYAQWVEGSVHEISLTGVKTLLKHYEQYLVDNGQDNISINEGRAMLDDRFGVFLNSLGIKEIYFSQEPIKEAIKW